MGRGLWISARFSLGVQKNNVVGPSIIRDDTGAIIQSTSFAASQSVQVVRIKVNLLGIRSQHLNSSTRKLPV
jgi:hypothetical protein